MSKQKQTLNNKNDKYNVGVCLHLTSNTVSSYIAIHIVSPKLQNVYHVIYLTYLF
jgi:hypothetical protein